MKKRLFLFALIAAFIFPFASNAQDLISAKELSKLMKDKNTVIVSCRKAEDFKKVHIKGAVNVWHNDLYNNDPVKSVIKSAADLAKIFGEKGISNTNNIVLYDAGNNKYAGRVYWILKYLGAENVKVLNGHMDAWKKARKPLTKNPSKRKASTFTAKVNNAILANIADVKANKAIVVDVRETPEFSGAEGKTAKLGHIPGAKNLVYTDLANTDGSLKSKEEIAKVASAAGLSADKEIILYCTSSVRAGIVYMALTSILGYTNVKVYDGAFYEWIADPANKVVK